MLINNKIKGNRKASRKINREMMELIYSYDVSIKYVKEIKSI